MSREISLASIERAPLTGTHDLVGVSDRGGPVEALAERVAHEGARCGVVAAHTRMDVSNKLATMGIGMHRCKMPDAAGLYSLSSTVVNDLAILAMCLASDRSG
jgi:hypothetical protein